MHPILKKVFDDIQAQLAEMKNKIDEMYGDYSTAKQEHEDFMKRQQKSSRLQSDAMPSQATEEKQAN